MPYTMNRLASHNFLPTYLGAIRDHAKTEAADGESRSAASFIENRVRMRSRRTSDL